MTRSLLGFAICVLLGAAIDLWGADDALARRGAIVPPVPERWAAPPTGGRVELTLVRSEGVVAGVAAGLSRAEIALRRSGALAFVDGRVFATSPAAARNVLRALAWDGLPVDLGEQGGASLDRFPLPRPAPLAWQLRRDAFLGLKTARDFAAVHPGFAASVALGALLLATASLANRSRRSRRVREAESEAPLSPWRRRRAERPLRVVLVPDAAMLVQLRAAIGEHHVVAATEHAFAFADGWVLAAHKGSVFELATELGWRMRPIEMATRAELVGEGHALSPLPGDDDADTLGLLEALQVCGPVAHGTLPHIATATG